jgi:multicomponent Na+:H+ antiporter subunit D
VLVLLAGVSGAFLTGDLFNLYVWFEVMLIASFGLMVLGGRPVQLDATVKYGIINFLATTFFLVALGLLYGLTGTLNMADVARVAPAANPAALASVAALLLLAFGIKAAAFPVNAWLPASYHAPPVTISALMAGLLTKVGVYALLRTLVAVLPASREVLEPAILVIVLGTLVIAPLGAIAETNLRRAIGFLVMGGIGAAAVGLVLPSGTGVAGSVVYAVHAMLTMTALYLVAGVVEAITGETDTRRMGGLYARTTATAILFLVLILAVSGVPPFLGFWPKLMLLQAALSSGAAAAGPGVDWAAIAIAAAILLNALLTLIAGTRLWSFIFWRPEPAGAARRTLGANETWLRLGAAGALTAVIAVLGLWPEPLTAAGSAAAVDLLDLGRYSSAVGIETQP